MSIDRKYEWVLEYSELLETQEIGRNDQEVNQISAESQNQGKKGFLSIRKRS